MGGNYLVACTAGTHSRYGRKNRLPPSTTFSVWSYGAVVDPESGRGKALSNAMVGNEIQVKSGFLWRVSLIAGLGGVLYGYDMGIIAAALIFVRDSLTLTIKMQEIVVSIVLVGAMLGAIIGGTVADRIGRRATLLWGASMFIVGSILAPLAP